ncbi:G-protein coupled receptor 15-like [Brienomyrus brachyistius]|uniref:G-protein coupled receptor 15-like n=1 Tax=Brienomyrus brachyistius TaxID=42636 RepID=UPI0020B443D6|nr:G-protein coupled receptor 15-like [Brienomyrus brachyistius]XP_048852330.1 G-protein coupled receptor 15-like [Brienomyrus brachyistius]
MDQENDSYVYYYDETDGNNCQVELGAALPPVRSAFYCLVMVVGVPANMALLLALWARHRGAGKPGSSGQRRSWTNSEILAANLAVSDLLFLGSLPIWIYTDLSSMEWRGGAASCKAVPYITALNMYVVVWLVTFMSIDRYLAVVCQSLYRQIKRRPLVVWGCALTWLTSALLALPVLRSRLLEHDEESGSSYCRETEISPELRLCLILFNFFLPLSVTVFCYGSLIRVLSRHSQGLTHDPAPGPGPAPPGRSVRRSMRVVLWVVTAFILSWLPFNTFRLLRVVGLSLTPGSDASCWLQWVAAQGIEWTAPLAFANSCVNPLVFGAVSHTLLCWDPAARLLGLRSRVGGQSGASSHTSPSSWEGRSDRG